MRHIFVLVLVALAAAVMAVAAQTTAPPSPEDDGPRRWEVDVVAGALNLRAEPSTTAVVIGRFASGDVLTNLGCNAVDGRAWCDVQSMYGGPRGWVAAEYLKPAEGQDGVTPTGYDDSAVRAGQGDFDATGPLPCAASLDGPIVDCVFGVARDVGGDATLVVTRPDGKTRAIYFVHGEAVGADTAEADGGRTFSARRENDVTIVHVGPERYEVVDAIPLGG